MNSGALSTNSLQYSVFKKYFENYIVNYCVVGKPSLKIVSFLKISYLNNFMLSNGWGFVDTAGGSLFNYLDGLNVVTADYDFKIYFYTDTKIEERKAFIKLWFINISHVVNEYMKTNKFLNDIKIEGEFYLNNISIGVKFELTHVLRFRPFISRGKEPDLFPVPLYSDDLLLVNRFIYGECKTPIKMNVSYFDLVFKDYEHHYINHDFGDVGYNKFILPNVTAFVCDNTKPIVPFSNLQSQLQSQPQMNFFLVRTPTFYEIWTDVTSLLTEPTFLLGRMSTRKNEKDIGRVQKLIKYINQFIDIWISIHQQQQHGLSLEQQQILKGLSPEQQQIPKGLSPEQLKQLEQLQFNLIENVDISLIIEYFKTEEGKQILLYIPTIHTQPHITECYYQFNLYCNNYIIHTLVELIRDSFTTKFNEITKIYWSFLLCTKKYSEFKNATDIDRITNRLIIDFIRIEPTTSLPGFTFRQEQIKQSATLNRINEKIDPTKRNQMKLSNRTTDAFPTLSYENIKAFIITTVYATAMAGGSNKKHTRRRRHTNKHSKSTRNKNQKQQITKPKKNKTKKNKKRKQKNKHSVKK